MARPGEGALIRFAVRILRQEQWGCWEDRLLCLEKYLTLRSPSVLWWDNEHAAPHANTGITVSNVP